MKNSILFNKIYGALIGSAIGDAMGGPIESLPYENIQREYGYLDTLLPYSPSQLFSHGSFALEPGSCTDDTRMARMLTETMIQKKFPITAGDIALAMGERYFHSQTEMEKGFWEEYYLKGIHRESKEIFGGQPTNGAIMGIAPWGARFPCDPNRAYALSFDAMFMTGGYARHATSMAAAAIASAMKPGSTWQSVVQDMMEAAKKHKQQVEGPLWSSCWAYEDVGRKPEKLVEAGLAVAEKYSDPCSVRQELYQTIVQEFYADAAESLAIAMSFFRIAQGDFYGSVTGCVNFGRDNDSSASIAGAISGALCGVEGIPAEWVETVEKACEGPSFYELAQQLYQVVLTEIEEKKLLMRNLESLV